MRLVRSLCTSTQHPVHAHAGSDASLVSPVSVYVSIVPQPIQQRISASVPASLRGMLQRFRCYSWQRKDPRFMRTKSGIPRLCSRTCVCHLWYHMDRMELELA